VTRAASARRLLLPLVPLYRLGLALREMRLGSSLEPVRRLHFPVISIGSLSAGGSGKTPMTVALAQALDKRGLHVDVLSRGYGRKSQAVLLVDPNGDAEEFGDEPLLMARNAGVPVYVSAQRYEAGLMAEHSTPFSSVLHLLDDGFQHRQLHRDIDILLLDGGDLLDCLLPAGNLREPIRAFKRATILAIPADNSSLKSRLKATGWQGPVWRVRRRMEVPAIEGAVIAFCGIARSEQFYAGLEAAGLELASRISFPDHHHYNEDDLKCIRETFKSARAVGIVTTEKDRVRLSKRGDSLPIKTAGLRIEIESEDEAVADLVARLGA
jgi:tetraacyldisaccharide 4'-kinase